MVFPTGGDKLAVKNVLDTEVGENTNTFIAPAVLLTLYTHGGSSVI